jgi:hypothetical protein
VPANGEAQRSNPEEMMSETRGDKMAAGARRVQVNKKPGADAPGRVMTTKDLSLRGNP